MNQITPVLQADDEAALAARAAWLHFAGGRTQGEVAELLGIQSTKAHRLIAKARSEGMIRVIVEGPIAGCIALEEELILRHGLKTCIVVPNIDDGELPLRTLGTAGARFLLGLITSGRHKVIGIGNGRTLAAAADMLPTVAAQDIRFVSLLGGLTRKLSASPFDVIHKLAERTGAEAYLLPVPFFANSKEDREVLALQAGVSHVIEMARSATLCFAGIGEVDPNSYLSTGGMVEPEGVAAAHDAGACAELLGNFFNSEGKHTAPSITDRAMAPRLSDLKQHNIVALAGGTAKSQAIRAMLLSGLLSGLITDEATARRLVSETPGQVPGNRSGKSATGLKVMR